MQSETSRLVALVDSGGSVGSPRKLSVEELGLVPKSVSELVLWHGTVQCGRNNTYHFMTGLRPWSVLLEGEVEVQQDF